MEIHCVELLTKEPSICIVFENRSALELHCRHKAAVHICLTTTSALLRALHITRPCEVLFRWICGVANLLSGWQASAYITAIDSAFPPHATEGSWRVKSSNAWNKNHRTCCVLRWGHETWSDGCFWWFSMISSLFGNIESLEISWLMQFWWDQFERNQLEKSPIHTNPLVNKSDLGISPSVLIGGGDHAWRYATGRWRVGHRWWLNKKEKLDGMKFQGRIILIYDIYLMLIMEDHWCWMPMLLKQHALPILTCQAGNWMSAAEAV